MPAKRFIPSATLFLALISAIALCGAAPARAQMCNDICSPQSLCSTECEVCARGIDNPDGSCSNGTIWTTCSAQGYACTSCYPNWQDTGRVHLGVFQKNYFFYCEQFSVDQVFQTDLNHCQPNRSICQESHVGTGYGVGVSCCAGGMCWGQSGC